MPGAAGPAGTDRRSDAWAERYYRAAWRRR